MYWSLYIWCLVVFCSHIGTCILILVILIITNFTLWFNHIRILHSQFVVQPSKFVLTLFLWSQWQHNQMSTPSTEMIAFKLLMELNWMTNWQIIGHRERQLNFCIDKSLYVEKIDLVWANDTSETIGPKNQLKMYLSD